MTARFAAPALALGGGFLVALSMPPWGWWPLAFAGIAAFDVALGAEPDRRARFGRGALFGLGWLGMGMGWMWQLTAPGYLVACVIVAALHGLAALVAPTGRWAVVGRPAAHSLVEALRFSFPFGGFPLASIGIGQVGGPLAGVVRVGGVILITWVVFQIGFALPAVVRSVERRRIGAPLSAGLVGVVVVLIAAVIAPRAADTGRSIDIAAVQGGGAQGTSALEVPTDLVTARHVEATRGIAPDPSLDMVLWPENVIDESVFEGSPSYLEVADEAARLGVPFVVGITDDPVEDPDRFRNAQVVVTPAGDITGRYDKVRRVPFGEYVPLRGLLEALGAPVDRIGSDAVAGTGPAFLDLPDGTRIGVVISWEVFFGGRARDGVRNGAELIVNPTNGASYTGTIVQTQQVASSRLRAIETGRWVVQAAPTGFSAFVAPDGTVIDRTAVSEQAVIRRAVELREGRTWYVSLGDRPWIALLIVVLGATRILARVDRRRDQPPPQTTSPPEPVTVTDRG